MAVPMMGSKVALTCSPIELVLILRNKFNKLKSCVECDEWSHASSVLETLCASIYLEIPKML